MEELKAEDRLSDLIAAGAATVYCSEWRLAGRGCTPRPPALSPWTSILLDGRAWCSCSRLPQVEKRIKFTTGPAPYMSTPRRCRTLRKSVRRFEGATGAEVIAQAPWLAGHILGRTERRWKCEE